MLGLAFWSFGNKNRDYKIKRIFIELGFKRREFSRLQLNDMINSCICRNDSFCFAFLINNSCNMTIGKYLLKFGNQWPTSENFGNAIRAYQAYSGLSRYAPASCGKIFLEKGMSGFTHALLM